MTAFIDADLQVAVQITQDVRAVREIEFCVENVRKPLAEAGLHKKTARLEFAQAYRNWTDREWPKVKYSDECRMNLYSSAIRTRFGEGEESNTLNINPHGQFYGGSVIMWGSLL